jgi:pimeloyl-ACP methyl ester carboxylesterase
MTHTIDRLVTRGISVRAVRRGAGPPALFLHGAGGMPVGLPFFERLAQRLDVLIPEHPFFGASDAPPWIRSVPDLAMYYLDVLDTVYSSPVHVIGHSFGGWIAAEAGIRNTRRFASLTLLAPAGIRLKGTPPGDTFIWSPEEFARNRFHDQSLAQAVLAAPPLDDAQADEQLQNQLAAARFGWEPRWFNPDLEKWLHRIDVPTHILWGVQDMILPAAYARLWGERVPGAEVTMIDACGHIPQIEQAEIVTAKVIAFLDRVAP